MPKRTMSYAEIREMLTNLGLVEDHRRMAYNLDIRNRTAISAQDLHYTSNPKQLLVEILRQQRRSLDAFIADLEKKVIEY